eukprot:7098174-Prymnesium_polylepis.1
MTTSNLPPARSSTAVSCSASPHVHGMTATRPSTSGRLRCTLLSISGSASGISVMTTSSAPSAAHTSPTIPAPAPSSSTRLPARSSRLAHR